MDELQPGEAIDRVFFDDGREQYDPKATEAITTELLHQYPVDDLLQ